MVNDSFEPYSDKVMCPAAFSSPKLGSRNWAWRRGRDVHLRAHHQIGYRRGIFVNRAFHWMVIEEKRRYTLALQPDSDEFADGPVSRETLDLQRVKVVRV
ncbi:hypothetical protein AMTRI_Chr05g61210 [Amborella trichopoda]